MNNTSDWARYPVTHPWLTLAACLLLTIVCGLGTTHYHNTIDFRFFFSDDNPQLAAYTKLQSTYGSEEFIFVAIESVDGNDPFTDKNLKSLESLTAKAWMTPYSLRVDSLTNFPYTQASDDEFSVDDLYSSAANLDASQIERRRQFALNEPATVNALVSQDGKVGGMRILIQLPGVDRAAETPEVVYFVRKMVAQFEQDHPQFRTYLSGQVIVDQAFPESTQGDQAFVWPAFFIVILVLLGVIFRSLTFVIITLVIALFSIATGVGILGWTGMKINAAVTVAPIMILILAIADCVHILSRYRLFRQLDQPKQQALIESLQQNTRPVMLTSAFTAAGFLTLHFNDSPPYQALGYIVCAGVLAAWLYSMVLLPALIMLIPHSVETGITLPSDTAKTPLKGWSNWIIAHHRGIALIGSNIIIAGLMCLPLNRINDDPVKYFGSTQVMRQHMEFVNNHITGLGALNYSIPTHQGQTVTDPQYLELLDRFGQWISQQPNVVHVDSIADIIKRLNQSWHNDNPDFYSLPNEPDASAQLLLLYEMSLPFGADLGTMIAADRHASRVRVTMNNTAGDYHIDLDERARQWLSHETGSTLAITSASAPLMFAHIGERSMQGILAGLIGSLFVMGLVLTRLFKSIKLGLISIICNVLPVALAFAAWGIINGNIDVGLTVTLGIAFGIVVDDTIHFLGKYHHARQALSLPAPQAVQFAFSRVGPAILITSIILIAGFAMLGFSAMNITANTSILTTITIAFALLIDMLFIPALLILFDRSPSKQTFRESKPHG